MATATRPSHAREPSLTVLDCDANPGFSFPARPHERSRSVALHVPPSECSGNDRGSSYPRRGSAPLLNMSAPVIAPTLVTGTPRPNSSSESVDTKETDQLSMEAPIFTTTFSVRTAASSGNMTRHNREPSELLKVPVLEQNVEDEPLPSPKKMVPPPPTGARPRRGHAHRRSGAISSSDVWALMNQSAPALPLPPALDSSKLGTGSESDQARLSPGASPRLSWSAPVSPGGLSEDESAKSSPAIPPSIDEPGLDTRRGSRVSFIDQVEIIPRPMSAETLNSNTTTIRGHGTTDSMSSFASLASSTTPTIRVPSPTRRPHNRTRSNSQTLAKPTAALRAQSDRPSTAGAILSSPVESTNTSPAEFPPASVLRRPASASPFLVNSPTIQEGPLETQPEKRAHKKCQSDFSPLRAVENADVTDPSEPSAEGISSPQKKKKKGKKVKSWAGNILGKGKLKHTKTQRKSPLRSPTPPISRPENANGENEWIATSWNESYVLMPVDTSPAFDGLKAPAVSVDHDSPVIDLDAALGPFKTPAGTNPGVAAAVARKRRMHSAAYRGPGGYLHRRSESMPEMQLFAWEDDMNRAMEDVFEEDEEEETSEDSGEEESDSDEDEGQISGGDGLGIGISHDTPRPSSEHFGRATDVQDVNEKRLSTATIKTDSTATPVAPPQQVTAAPSSPRRKATLADIITHPSTESISTFPSPNGPLDSPLTFVTASSNLNTPVQLDFPSDASSGSFDPYRDYLGEPGPEMRMSVDDIPSLTSSSSTMTMNLAYSGMPSTPSTTDVNIVPSVSLPGGKEKKEKSKRWSRVWGFWKLK